MNIPGWGRIQTGIKRVQNRLSAKAVILIYHRVAESLPDPQRLAVNPANFSRQLEVLTEMTCPVPLEEIPVRLKSRKRNDPLLSAVTFDDGYADNLQAAAPILARHGVPATVFVVTNAINHLREFWWDDLGRILLRPDLPKTLELKIGGKMYRWAFRQDVPVRSGWDVYAPPRRTSQKAYLQISRYMRPLSFSEQEDVLSQLYRWSGMNPQPRKDHLTMTERELKQLTAGGLITIGAHTVTHPVLSAMDWRTQSFEINASRLRLEKLLGSPVRTFSYPFGRDEDYSRQTVKLVRSAGFVCACSTAPGLVTRWTDPLQLPRFSVGDWSGEQFRKELENLIS